MSLRFKKQIFGECFFITTSFIDKIKLGNKKGVYEALAESLNYRLEKTNSKFIAYVFMPSQLHLVLYINGRRLAGFMRDFKKYTAQKSIGEMARMKKIWEDRYDRQAIWSEKVLLTKIGYVHYNPVKSGLVEIPEDWYYSSAADYTGRKNGPVKVWKEWRL
jgi:REP element-mobilizing transposase RayT